MLEQFLFVAMCQNNPIMEKMSKDTCKETQVFFESYRCETKCIKVRGSIKETTSKVLDSTSKVLKGME